MIETKVQVESGVFAETDLEYDHAGHLRTQWLPDPDRTGSLGRPRIEHDWNWADLEIVREDPLGGIWQSAHDQLGRVVDETSAMGATTLTTYQLGTSQHRIVRDAPSGASVTTDLDVLGRTVSEALEGYDPATTTYDVTNQPLVATDPSGIKTKTDVNDLGQLSTRTEFYQSANQVDHAITTYAYDAAGRLSQVDGPRSSPDDRITYDYDAAGRLTSAQHEGVTLPSSATKASVAVTYDDAGERIRVSQPLTTGTTMVRDWTYDVSGRLATYDDALSGSTTFSYNLAGWPVQVDDGRPSLVVHMGYDDLGRLVCRHTAACTQATSAAETYAYDAAGNMTKAKNPAVTFDMTYDAESRLWKTDALKPRSALPPHAQVLVKAETLAALLGVIFWAPWLRFPAVAITFTAVAYLLVFYEAGYRWMSLRGRRESFSNWSS